MKSDGTILKSNGITASVGHDFPGIYELTLRKSGTNCAVVASITPGHGGSVTGSPAVSDQPPDWTYWPRFASRSTACAAARRASGTRYGEHET